MPVQRKTQRGSALLLIVIAAVTLIGVVGLALDASHLGYMKARLQSTVDAMALAAAKRLDETGSTASACEAARTTLLANAQDFRELQAALPTTIVCPGATWFQIQYSASVTPFNAGTTPASYVRVRIAQINTRPSLARALGFFGDLAVTASAIAGPSAPVQRLCSLLPIAVCGDRAATGPNFGYEPGRVYVLKGKTKTTEGGTFKDYYFLDPDRLVGGQAYPDLRRNFAGGFGSCLVVGSPDLVPLKTGVNIGPVRQGVNTRFNDYGGAGGQVTPGEFPPDVLIGGPSPLLSVNSTGESVQGSTIITYGSQVTGRNRKDYLDRLAAGPTAYDIQPLPAPGIGALLRREVAVPIAQCPPEDQGSAQGVRIRGAGCFFLLQKMGSGGSESDLFAEFIPNCEAAGRPGPDPGGGGPYIIQMFRDPSSKDS
jgi:hypothetical protein